MSKSIEDIITNIVRTELSEVYKKINERITMLVGAANEMAEVDEAETIDDMDIEDEVLEPPTTEPEDAAPTFEGIDDFMSAIKELIAESSLGKAQAKAMAIETLNDDFGLTKFAEVQEDDRSKVYEAVRNALD